MYSFELGILLLQESVVFWADDFFPGASAQPVRERHPAPRIEPRLPVLSVYIDNFLVFGGSTADANGALKGLVTACDRRDVGIYAAHSAAPVLAALGMVVDGTRTVLHHQLPRLWRFVLTTQAFLRRHQWRGEILDVWLGHAFFISALARSLLSVLQEVYSVAHAIRYSSGVPTPKIRMDLRVFVDLFFLVQCYWSEA